mmetsp:Transcript_25181/g.51217  ORF Transcript_25181/g.51217 Transcript_25181/m.51217 type:complete len:239 (-) Transcript_25181:71-787(-)
MRASTALLVAFSRSELAPSSWMILWSLSQISFACSRCSWASESSLVNLSISSLFESPSMPRFVLSFSDCSCAISSCFFLMRSVSSSILRVRSSISFLSRVDCCSALALAVCRALRICSSSFLFLLSSSIIPCSLYFSVKSQFWAWPRISSTLKFWAPPRLNPKVTYVPTSPSIWDFNSFTVFAAMLPSTVFTASPTMIVASCSALPPFMMHLTWTSPFSSLKPKPTPEEYLDSAGKPP